VIEILNYISAWIGLLTAGLMLCVFFFELASKKPISPRGGNEKKLVDGHA
jgi:hypothetical protein